MKKHYIPLIIIAAIILAFISGRGCKSTPTIQPNRIDTLKLTQIKYKDTVRIKEVIRNKYTVMWKEVRYDSITPCETKLLICDTVIRIDSSLICSLKDVIRVDSLIILSQDSVIVGLDKQVKRERNKKRFWQVFAGVAIVANSLPR